MSFNQIPIADPFNQNKPLPFLYFLHFYPYNTYPIIQPIAFNNSFIPQQNYQQNTEVGNTQDNCIVIEDENQLNVHSQAQIQGEVQQSEQQRVGITDQKSASLVKRHREELDEFSPYIKINVYRQHQSSNQHPFILQNDRILSSQSKSKEITIGRKKQQNDDGQNTCDISLPHGDKYVERTHCKIFTDRGFNHARMLTPEIILFFSLKKSHPIISQFTQNIIKLIYAFIKKSPEFYLADVGTQMGTYMRIKKDKPREILQDNTYLIGADTCIHVQQLNDQKIIQKKQKDFNYLLQALVRERFRKEAKIHGLTIKEQEQFESMYTEYLNTKKKGRQQFKFNQCDRPILKIEFYSPTNLRSQIHIFVAKYDEESCFKIGRSTDCDVVVSINTVSRKQAQILFKNNKWLMFDGEGGRESANGTWQSLQSYSERNAEKKQQSQQILIEDQFEIKISDNIVKFDFVNFGTTKKRKLNSTNILALLE